MSEPNKRGNMPVLLIAPGSMKTADIRRAQRHGGFLVIECEKADEARFLEAPALGNLDQQALAGMRLVRYIASMSPGKLVNVYDLTKFFVDAIIREPDIPSVAPTKRIKP